MLHSTTVTGNTIIIEFSSVESGLLASRKGLFGFKIAGRDKRYVSAEARIADNKVVVSSAAVAAPVYVRHAWSDSSSASLFNKENFRLPLLLPKMMNDKTKVILYRIICLRAVEISTINQKIPVHFAFLYSKNKAFNWQNDSYEKILVIIVIRNSLLHQLFAANNH